MTTLSDTPGEGLAPCPFCGGTDVKAWDNAVACRNTECGATGPDLGHCVGAECRAEAIAAWNRRPPSVASDTAALPSGYEGLVERLTAFHERLAHVRNASDMLLVREAIAALGRVQPVAVKPLLERYRSGLETLATTFYKDDQYQDYAKHVLATPPAPQPALALIEELTAARDFIDGMSQTYNFGCEEICKRIDTAIASAQGEAAQPAAEGWVDWPGLKQPVDDDTVIEFLADDGVIERRLARYMRWELPFEYRLPASSPAASQDGGRE